MTLPPTFSVIIPVHNNQDTITRCISSVLQQTIQPEEVILVDDGSTDYSYNVVLDLLTSLRSLVNFTILRVPHAGAANARNLGLLYSSGTWLCFLDADDTWHSNKLESLSHAIIHNPDVNMIAHNELFMHPDLRSHASDLHQYYSHHQNLTTQLFKRNFLSTSAVSVHSSIIRHNSFCQQLSSSQDYDFWLQLSSSARLVYLPEVLSTYYINRPGSISLSSRLKRIRNTLLVLHRHRQTVNLATYISISAKHIFFFILSYL